VAGLTRTYTFVFDPAPEGGFVVTCPALPGLVTQGDTIEEARVVARDAMEGYIATLIEDGEPVPESDAPQTTRRRRRPASIAWRTRCAPMLATLRAAFAQVENTATMMRKLDEYRSAAAA
jgi:antitoxin HicB